VQHFALRGETTVFFFELENGEASTPVLPSCTLAEPSSTSGSNSPFQSILEFGQALASVIKIP
jgi:hypothetical protein